MLLSKVLNSISVLVEQNPTFGFRDRLDTLLQERHYLFDYMRRGVKDEKRYDIYQDLLCRASVLLCDIEKAVMTDSNHYLASLKKEHATETQSSQSLIEQLADSSLSPSEHIRILNRAFCTIMLQPSWRESDSRLWLSYLVSDETSVFDASAIVSAIMMSGYLAFSYEKFRTLVITYQMAVSEEVRQRALIGWMVCYDNRQEAFIDKQNELLWHLAVDRKDTVQECVKALMQMTNCALTEKDTKDFQQNLAPRLYKAQMRQLSEIDNTLGESPIDEILNPSKTEQEMTELEADIRKLGDIQKKGVDLFFDGFSHMKRYPFFYKIVNWFVPFDTGHPDIADAYAKMSDMKFFENSMAAGPFCSSDKYSFVFAFSHVVNQLPENLLKMMNNGEVAMIGAEMQRDGMQKSATYVRRMVLQDLYRFFNLFPQYKFRNMFGGELSRIDLIMCQLAKYNNEALADYGRFLLRRNETRRLEVLLSQTNEDDDACRLLRALLFMKNGDDASAYDILKELYSKDQSPVVLKNYAHAAFNSSHFKVAAQLYHELKTLQPDNLSYQLHFVLSEANSGRGSLVMNEMYRLEYENEDNIAVRRVLAWILLLNGEPEKADSVMQKILQSDASLLTPSDYLNASYAKWFTDDMAMALHYLSQFKRLSDCDLKQLRETIYEDSDMLAVYNITDLHVSLLLDGLA